jgi:Ca2+-binding RTX toxin-like protein
MTRLHDEEYDMRTTHTRTSVRRNLARLALVAAASSTLLVGLVGTGHAASATVSVVNGNDVQFIGTDVTNDIRVTSDPSGAVFVQGSGVAGPGCTATATQGIKCLGTSRIDFILLDMRGGSDAITVQTAIRTHVMGGEGTDTYFGSTTSTGTNVFFVGGPGDRDEANYSRSTSGVAVDLDDAFDDGRIGVDTDNITGTVERLIGTDHADSLRGNNANNSIFGGLGADSLRGGGGNDEISAIEGGSGSSTADKDLSCGTGTDLIRLDGIDPAPAACETVQRSAA